jgi:hypothetical protein
VLHRLDLLKPPGKAHELLKRLDLLPLEHVPSNRRQIETADRPCVGIIKNEALDAPN